MLIVVKPARIPRTSLFVDYPQMREFHKEIIWVNRDDKMDAHKIYGTRGLPVLVYPKHTYVPGDLTRFLQSRQCKFLKWPGATRRQNE